jgi:hypothetical protein
MRSVVRAASAHACSTSARGTARSWTFTMPSPNRAAALALARSTTIVREGRD